ncbi:MAG: response regulator transcription factor [Acutalibacteraceae bacterium]
MKRVLVAEDEEAIREFIVIHLRRAGYTVAEAADGVQAMEQFEKQGDFDVAILDIMMPEMDGLQVCKALRAQDRSIGIIMLTARTQENDKVAGLLGGADDYVTKPFSPTELMARVDAVYRRVALVKGGMKPSSVLRSGDFVLDLRSRTLCCGGSPIDLTQIEFQLMEFFLQNQGDALSRAEILRKVWGSEYYGEDKIVDVNIRRLRMKIEQDPSSPKHLLTVRGIGYKWMN